ncbi:MAG: thioredoxin family protein [Akkermansiaceae bacterium]|jgi:thioredoxin-related protein|nr:thioredoxin family protein [Akkermansiaceae bacterium]
MKLARLLLAAFATTLTLASASAAGEGWTHDFEAAKKQAAAEGKGLLLDFTGSDWCAPCGMLEKEVFSQEEFIKAAKEKYVLVEVDFPQDQSKLAPETIAQNQKLQGMYVPAGYPTVFLCDADGKPYAAHSGYLEGGPVKFLELIENLRGNKTKLDESLAAAAKLEGKEKAQALIDALKGTGLPPASFSSFYQDVMNEVKALDPNDEIGYFSGAEKEAKFNELQTTLTTQLMNSQLDEVIDTINKEVDNYEGQEKQGLLLIRALACQQAFQFKQALADLDEIDKIGGNEELTAGVANVRAQVLAAEKAFNERLEKMNKKD